MGSVTAQPDPATSSSQAGAPEEDWTLPPYNSDDFRMYSLKVELCQKTYQHNIAACPYAHHGERAVRRDVRVHSYEAVVCQELLQKGKCPREDNCKAAHSVFEYWLHPSRYRTQLCREGTSCTRKVCFFAHTLAELRATPASADDGSNSGPVDPFSCGGKYSLAALNKKQQQQAEGGQSAASSKGSSSLPQPAANAASTLPRRNSADNSNAATKPQGQSRSRRSSSEAVGPSAAAAAAWSHGAAAACPTNAGHGTAGMASGACGVLPPRTSFNIQATSNINGLALQAPMQAAQQPVLLPVMAGELHAGAHCGNSIASLSSQLNAYSNSSIGSLSVGSSSSSNSLSPQLLQHVSLDSCFGVGSPATTPASQQLLLLLGNQAGACSSPTALQQSSSNLAEQLLGCSEPLPWACDLSPPQAAGQLRTLSHQQQMLQVLLPTATDAGLGGGGSPVAHQMRAACSPQLLSSALSTLNMGSPGAAPAVPGASCAPACQQQLVQFMMLPDAAANQPLQHQRYVVVPQASPSSYGAQASAMEACVLQCNPCLPLNAALLHDTSCAASSSRLGAGVMGQQMVPSLSAGFVSLPAAGMFDEQRLMACSTPQMAVTAWM